MSTRAQIAIFDSPTEIRSQYSHYDGGDHLKKELNTHFNSEEKAEELVGGDGSIRYIQDGEVSRFSDGRREADLYQKGSTGDLLWDFIEGADEGGAEFIHIWKDGKWNSISARAGSRATREKLADAVGYTEEEIDEDKDIMGEGYEAKWVKFLKESKGVDFDVIRKYIETETGRDDDMPTYGLDAYMESLKRDFEAEGQRRKGYDDYEMDDYVEDFENYIQDKRDA